MDTSTLAGRVYQILRRRILQGTYPPGQKLNLAELARDLQVSNTPIREAIGRLERIGLVEVIPYLGTRVKSLSSSQVADIFDVRIALEELAVRLVAQKDDLDVLQGMADAINAYEHAYHESDAEALIEADRAFHDALVQASGNSILLEMLPTLSDRTRLLLELSRSRQQAPQKGSESDRGKLGLWGHRRILNALRDRNEVQAVLELRQELTSGKERVLKQMSEAENQPAP